MKQVISIFFLLLLFSSCEKRKGCLQLDAMNFDVEAEKDCGCCEYERVVFYSRSPGYSVNGVPYSIVTYPIKLFIGDQEVGTITAFYQNGPGNPNLPGMVVYTPPTNTKKVEWFAKVTAPNGAFIILGSGTLNAGSTVRYVPIF
jgi:hypothetical protein